MTYTTRTGEQITITRNGALADVHVRAADGRTVASVEMPAADAYALVSNSGDAA